MDDDKVTFIVQARKYNFSKSALADRSEYFNVMFYGDFLERHKSVIELQGVSSVCWEQILYYLKHGKILRKDRMTVKEMLSLLDAANMFQFQDLREVVTKSILSCLNVHNTFEILEMACRLDVVKLIQKARAIALWLFDDVTKMDTFFKLKIEQVEGYVSDPALHSWSGELGVWEGIDRWINSGLDETPEERTKHMPTLIKCLYLNDLTWRDLKLIKLYKSVKESPLVLNAILEVTKDKMIKEGIRIENSETETKEEASEETKKFIAEWEQSKPRKLPLIPSIVGNIRTGPETISPCILKFSETEMRYIPVLRLNKVENSLGSMVGFKVINFGSKLFVFGGEMMTRQSAWNHAIWMYDQIFGTWTFLSNLLKPVRHISACCTGDDLYILGGFGRHRVLQEAVYRFSLKSSTWKVCAPLPKAMYSVACCSYKGFVYIFESYIYQYVPATDIWIKLLQSPVSKGFTNAMASDTYIYLAGAYTRCVYKFNPNLPHKAMELVGKFKNECVQACLIDDHVYSLSQDEFGDDIYCEKLNVNTGKRTMLYEGTTDSKIVDLNPRHHHGCFPLLVY